MKRYLLLIALFAISCGRIDIEQLVETPKEMAVTFLLQNNSLWQFPLVPVKALTDRLYYEAIENPSITLKYNNQTFTNYSLMNEPPLPFYISTEMVPNIPEKAICSLEIEKEGYPTLTATDTMPIMPDVRDISLENLENRLLNPVVDISLFKFMYSLSGTLRFKLNLSEEQARYYLVQIKVENNLYNTEPRMAVIGGDDSAFIDSTYYSNLSIRYEDERIENERGEFDSQLYGNGTAEIVVRFSGRYLRRSQRVKEMEVEILSLSPAYYEYLTDLTKTVRNNTNIFNEPTNSYSNVEGGYGVFVLANKFSKKIDI